ncbi:MAG: peptidoglycan D,D-transpeptidase FtsI family protein [Acidimicrobiales bacterium]
MSAGGSRRAPAARSVRRRLVIMAGVIGLALVAVAGRLTDVQLLGGGQRYVDYGHSQLVHEVPLRALRGSLLDRNGNVLAMSVQESDVYADPGKVGAPAAAAAQLAPVLKLPVAQLTAELSGKTTFVYLARQVNDGVAAQVRKLDLAGIGLLADPQRFAPDGSLAASVLGFTSTDGRGLAGLEHQYDKALKGTAGSAVVAEDPAGSALPAGIVSRRAADPGRSVELTLDTALQYETEQALSQEIVRSKALRGTAIIEDARDGQILAMANLQRQGSKVVPSSSNDAVGYTFEPGSVMKLTTFAGALSRGIVNPSTVLDVPSQLAIDGSVFRDSEVHGDERLTATQVLAQSSNIGTIEIAQRLGAPAVASWIDRFGFGSPTGLGFPGESAGIVKPASQWSPTAIGAAPIGQEDAVTAMQLLDAYTAVANGGVTVPPSLVRGVVRPDGSLEPVHAPAPHRVVTAAVASELTGMLEHVVTPAGTAPGAAIPGYTVAGKTGTAEIPRANGPGYQPGAFMATFVGFVPAQHPALSAIVVLDQPTPIFGGQVAAPVFAQICQQALRLLDVPPPAPAAGSGGRPGTQGPASTSTGGGSGVAPTAGYHD